MRLTLVTAFAIATLSAACDSSITETDGRAASTATTSSAGGASGGSGSGTAASGGEGGAGAEGGAATGGSGGTGAGGEPGQAGAGSGGASACATTCAGCCMPTGQCREGTSAYACGEDGAECQNCAALGFGCVGQQCAGNPPTCGSATCDGCCDGAGQCRLGTEIDACGTGGLSCSDCGASGEGCAAGVCEGPPPACGPSTCGGCCDGAGQCQTGTADGACGAAGAACESCSALGEECLQPGSYCGALPPCGALTCSAGCCDPATGLCRDGKTDALCGTGGQLCNDCEASGQACSALGYCYAGVHCGADNCAGCCMVTGECKAGTSSSECGAFGALCDDCTSQNAACEGSVCDSGSVCPKAYAGCSPGSLTAPPQPSTACTTENLSALSTACQGPSPGSTCSEAMQDLFQANPACFGCVSQFVGDDAYARCLASFLSKECNHDLTCAAECSSSVCGECSDAEQDGCQTEAFAAAGTCSPYANGYYCAQAAIGGPGAVCDWQAVGGDTGAWLVGVWTYFCH